MKPTVVDRFKLAIRDLLAKFPWVALDTLTTRFFFLFIFLLTIPLATVIIFTVSLLESHLQENSREQLEISKLLFSQELAHEKQGLAMLGPVIQQSWRSSGEVIPALCNSYSELICLATNNQTGQVTGSNVKERAMGIDEPALVQKWLISEDPNFMAVIGKQLFILRAFPGNDNRTLLVGKPLGSKFLHRLSRSQPNWAINIWIFKEPFSSVSLIELARTQSAEATLWERGLAEKLSDQGSQRAQDVSLENNRYLATQSLLYGASEERIARVIYILPMAYQQLLLKNYFVGIAVIAMASLIFSVLLAMFMGRTITQPLLKLIGQVNHISRENVLKEGITVAGVHEINQLSQAFNRMISRLRQEYKIKDEFVATLTHDLKVPLIAEKQTLAYLQKETYGPLSGEQQEVVGILKSSNQSCLSLVNGILEVYRYEADNVALMMEPFNLVELLEETMDELKSLAREKNIELTLDNRMDRLSPEEKEEESFIYADRLEIKRVFQNLISNALTNTSPYGKVSCFVTNAGQYGATTVYKVSGLQHSTLRYPVKLDNCLLVSIQDSGTGIAGEDLPNLFKQFAARRGRNPMSIGLGLYNCYQVVQAHNGHLWVETTEGEGTAVSFILAQNKERARDRRKFSDRRKTTE